MGKKTPDNTSLVVVFRHFDAEMFRIIFIFWFTGHDLSVYPKIQDLCEALILFYDSVMKSNIQYDLFQSFVEDAGLFLFFLAFWFP